MGQDKGTSDGVAGLQKRVKSLLKEPENLRCCECRSKKNKPKFFSLLQTPERGQLGVFCCKECKDYHVALGADYATVKSLKKPEEWTEQDVVTLEKSGNKAVNAIYESGLEGNHTDKHMGALASAAFVESKYKQCIYFSEKAYEEQLQLRAMIQFAKDQKPREQPPPPSTEDLVKKALKRQTMMPIKVKDLDAEEEVLLRGFGASPVLLDELSSSRNRPRRINRTNTNEEKHRTKKPVRTSKSVDEDFDEMPKRRGGKKSELPTSSSRRPGSRTAGGGLRRANTAEVSSHHHRRGGPRRHLSTGGDVPVSSHGPGGRRPGVRRVSTMEGLDGGNARLRRTTTTDRDRHSSRGDKSGGLGFLRSNTVGGLGGKSRPGERLAKRGGSGARGSIPRSGSREEIQTRSRGGERSSRVDRLRSASPVRNSRSPVRSLSPARMSRKDRQRAANSSVNNSATSVSYNESGTKSNTLDSSCEASDSVPDRDSLGGSSTALSSSSERDNGKNAEIDPNMSWSGLVDGVAWTKTSAQKMLDESLNKRGGGNKHKRRSPKNKKLIEEQIEGIAWSRNTAKETIDQNKRRTSVKMLADAVGNLEIPALARHKSAPLAGNSKEKVKESRLNNSQQGATDAFGMNAFGDDGFGTQSFDSQQGAMDAFGMNAFGDDGFGTQKLEGATDAFGTNAFGNDGFGTTSFQKETEASFAKDGFGAGFVVALDDSASSKNF